MQTEIPVRLAEMMVDSEGSAQVKGMRHVGAGVVAVRLTKGPEEGEDSLTDLAVVKVFVGKLRGTEKVASERSDLVETRDTAQKGVESVLSDLMTAVESVADSAAVSVRNAVTAGSVVGRRAGSGHLVASFMNVMARGAAHARSRSAVDQESVEREGQVSVLLGTAVSEVRRVAHRHVVRHRVVRHRVVRRSGASIEANVVKSADEMLARVAPAQQCERSKISQSL